MRERDEIARLSAEAMWADDAACKALEMRVLEVRPGYARLDMGVAKHMVNGHGMCHGGYIFTLADSAFAYACNSFGQRAVAQNCAITYVAPGRLGMRLVAEAQARLQQERAGIYDVTVRNEAGETIAEFRGHSRTLPGSLIEPAATSPTGDAT
jgi:acyl-CoA thioesterase